MGSTYRCKSSALPDKWVCVWWWGRHFSVVQVLLALSEGVEARGKHWVAVFLEQLADQSPSGVRGQSSLLAVHALPLQWRVRWDWFWVTHKQTNTQASCQNVTLCLFCCQPEDVNTRCAKEKRVSRGILFRYVDGVHAGHHTTDSSTLSSQALQLQNNRIKHCTDVNSKSRIKSAY